MNITHAKRANLRESAPKNMTTNHGLKHPCECASGKKFKHCCFAKPSRGWGWVRLYQDNWSMVVFTVTPETVPQADAAMHGASLVPVYSTYEVGARVAKGMPAAKPTWLVRMDIEDLERHIRSQFPPGTRVVLAIQPDVSPSGHGELREIIIAGNPKGVDVEGLMSHLTEKMEAGEDVVVDDVLDEAPGATHVD